MTLTMKRRKVRMLTAKKWQWGCWNCLWHSDFAFVAMDDDDYGDSNERWSEIWRQIVNHFVWLCPSALSVLALPPCTHCKRWIERNKKADQDNRKNSRTSWKQPRKDRIKCLCQCIWLPKLPRSSLSPLSSFTDSACNKMRSKNSLGENERHGEIDPKLNKNADNQRHKEKLKKARATMKPSITSGKPKRNWAYQHEGKEE